MSINFDCLRVGLSFSTGNTKTVKIDTQPPNLTKVSLSSLRNENKTLAKADQYIELKFDASENLKDPMVSIHGKNIQLYGIQDTWTATYQVDENDDLALNPLDLDGLKLWLDSSNIDGEYDN